MGNGIGGARNGSSKLSCSNAIAEARHMSSYLLEREFRGPGDTIEAAAYRVERKWGVPASLIDRLRIREVNDMLLSNWIKLTAGYEAACQQVERQAQHQQELAKELGANAAGSRLYRLGSLLARQTEGER